MSKGLLYGYRLWGVLARWDDEEPFWWERLWGPSMEWACAEIRAIRVRHSESIYWEGLTLKAAFIDIPDPAWPEGRSKRVGRYDNLDD